MGKPSLVLLRHEYNVASWEVTTMMSWVIFINFLCINRAGFVQSSTCVLLIEE